MIADSVLQNGRRNTMRRIGGRNLRALKVRSAPRRSTSHKDTKQSGRH